MPMKRNTNWIAALVDWRAVQVTASLHPEFYSLSPDVNLGSNGSWNELEWDQIAAQEPCAMHVVLGSRCSTLQAYYTRW